MKSITRRGIAAAVLALGLTVGGASAAFAYTPVAPGGTTTAGPGQTVSISVDVSSLPAVDASVVFTLTGEGVTGANLANIVKAASSSASVTKPRSNPTVSVTIPANGSGSYSLSATGATSGTALPAVSINSGVPLASGTGSATGLSNTGENPMMLLGLWVGGGALVLAGGALVVGNTVRRQRRATEVSTH